MSFASSCLTPHSDAPEDLELAGGSGFVNCAVAKGAVILARACDDTLDCARGGEQWPSWRSADAQISHISGGRDADRPFHNHLSLHHKP